MERVRFVSHNEKRILLHDFSNCDSREFATALKQATTMIGSQAGVSHLVLVDVTGLRIDPEIIGAAKTYIENSKDYVRAVAVVGLTGFQESMFTYAVAATKKQIASFRDLAEAKAWLIEKN
jgi:hypothetical protein